ncbi:MAG: UDP-N-acetylmuramoylalanine-D-glutamate ligase [Berkelbacteria bacterium GW2011_GWA1_36_9]|uniref:UDP-N-acetylmuramoylalanine--D-glutamate ligase n=1 Tax=Berkelbacteria bacterium GW2011_GWA1_36_9 TaxID=1618331 RepID=A0A0G0IS66_9BACT|nr:MAG: UDP-N-acetylmuramoylalanine-D-glutamate ligase [Berkelbacteria bacterium GW2011_GWA1_36_9]
MKNLKLKNLQNQKVGILGLGEENIALAYFLVAQGIDITICDQKSREELGQYYEKMKNLSSQVQFQLGANYLENLEKFNIIFRTPGLPYLNSKIQKAKNVGVIISSEIKLFFDLCPCPVVGVTGTKGKGTTTTLIAEILKWKSEIRNPKSEIYLGGNIGTSPISFLEKLTSDDIVVLELSSFQLQDMERSPHIAVVLDIKIDHLDYHQSRTEYIESKINIVKYQTKNDFTVVNADYLTSFEFGAESLSKTYWFSRRKSVDEGCFVKENQIVLRINNEDIPICKTDEIILKGEHNLENICAAVTASKLAGADSESIKTVVKSFKGLEHRLEFVRNFNEINFYNDSFSTTPDTTIAAIKSFKTPIILLVGGSEKNADYSELGQTIKNSTVKNIISIGQTAPKIIKAIGENHVIKITDNILSMEEAVKLALELGQKNDVVILSPASASFDRYKNYKERGEIFKKVVLDL